MNELYKERADDLKESLFLYTDPAIKLPPAVCDETLIFVQVRITSNLKIACQIGDLLIR